MEMAGEPERSEAKLNLGDAERAKATACGGGSMGGAGRRLAPFLDVYGPWQGREGVALSKRDDMGAARGGYASTVWFSVILFI